MSACTDAEREDYTNTIVELDVTLGCACAIREKYCTTIHRRIAQQSSEGNQQSSKTKSEKTSTPFSKHCNTAAISLRPIDPCSTLTAEAPKNVQQSVRITGKKDGGLEYHCNVVETLDKVHQTKCRNNQAPHRRWHSASWDYVCHHAMHSALEIANYVRATYHDS